MGQVTTWYMTEEERLAYIKKHPIIPTSRENQKESAFSNIHELSRKRKTKRSANHGC